RVALRLLFTKRSPLAKGKSQLPRNVMNICPTSPGMLKELKNDASCRAACRRRKRAIHHFKFPQCVWKSESHGSRITAEFRRIKKDRCLLASVQIPCYWHDLSQGESSAEGASEAGAN